MKLGAYIILRLSSFVFQIIGAIFIIFAIFNIVPYDPIGLIFFISPPGNEVERLARERAIRSSWGLDQPIYIQVYRFLSSLVTEGSLGNSWLGGSVNDIIANAIPYTLTIFAISFLIYTALSIILGVYSAARDQTFTDRTIKFGTSIGYGVPYFIIAIMAIFSFASSDYIVNNNLDTGFFNNLRFLLLPILIIVIAFTSYQYRIVRSELRGILTQNYIKTARAKGLPERTVIYKHGLRNGISQIITSSIITFPLALSAIIVIETLFQIPGLGLIIIQAVDKVNWGVIIGLSTLFLLFNGFAIMIADIITVIVDPRSEN